MAPRVTPAHEDCYSLPLLRDLRFVGTVHTLNNTKDYYARAYEEYMVLARVQATDDEMSVKRFFVHFDQGVLDHKEPIGLVDWVTAYELLKEVLVWHACPCGGPSTPSRINMFARICVSCGEPQWPRMDDDWEITPGWELTTDPQPSKKRKRPDTSSSRPDTSFSRPDTFSSRPDTSFSRPDTSSSRQDPQPDLGSSSECSTQSDLADTVILSEESDDDFPVHPLEDPEKVVKDYVRARLITGCVNSYEKCTEVYADFKAWANTTRRIISGWSASDFSRAIVNNFANKVKVLGTSVYRGIKFRE